MLTYSLRCLKLGSLDVQIMIVPCLKMFGNRWPRG